MEESPDYEADGVLEVDGCKLEEGGREILDRAFIRMRDQREQKLGEAHRKIMSPLGLVVGTLVLVLLFIGAGLILDVFFPAGPTSPLSFVVGTLVMGAAVIGLPIGLMTLWEYLYFPKIQRPRR